MLKQYLLYLFRWQLSTPILAICIYLLQFNTTTETIIANLIGGLIFFWIDKYIFKQSIAFPIWQIEEEVKCIDCEKISRGYRLVKTRNYDKTKDNSPEFRCEECSENKLEKLKTKGLKY